MNPNGGGAERYTLEVARALVRNGYSVDWFCSKFRNSKDEEVYENIKIIRRGNEFSVHFYGLIYAIKNFKNYDLIIDEFNGLGFFTFFLKNSILLIHQLYDKFWIYEMGKFFFLYEICGKVFALVL